MPGTFEWSDVALLLDFLESARISETARKLKLDETTVVRRLKRLQSVLDVPLIETRDNRLIATEAALALRGKAEMMFEAATQFQRASARQHQGPSGVVRITALRSVLRHIILPGLPEFRAIAPDIELNLIGEARNLSLTRREADIAIRLALPTGGEIVTRKLGDLGFGVYARNDADPEGLPWLGYTEELGVLPEAQWLERNRAGVRVAMRCNSLDLLASATSLGLGKSVLPCFMGDVEPHLARLSPSPVLSRELWLAVHSDDRNTLRIRVSMDFLFRQFEAMRGVLSGSRPAAASPAQSGQALPRSGSTALD